MGSARDGPGPPSRGAIGGSSNEAGAAFRSGIAAWIITHGLRGRDLPDLQLTNNQAVPVMVALEADYPVDDIAITLCGDGKAFIQAKRSVNLAISPTAEFFSVVQQ